MNKFIKILVVILVYCVVLAIGFIPFFLNEKLKMFIIILSYGYLFGYLGRKASFYVYELFK